MITGAHDKTIRLWDIRKPSTMATLTYHKKSVRALAMHPTECGPHACACLDTCLRHFGVGAVLKYSFLMGQTCSGGCVHGQQRVSSRACLQMECLCPSRRWPHLPGCLFWNVKNVVLRRYAFVGGSADNIKKYRLPVGEFLHNMLQNQKAIISCMAVNEDGVLVSGGDNGSLWCALAPEAYVKHTSNSRGVVFVHVSIPC